MRWIVPASVLLAAIAFPAPGQGRSVETTVHNLSTGGPGEIRSLDETEVCRFCHVPHTPVLREPLWGHALSEVARYRTARMRRSEASDDRAPQPDGSSRLCLSCHDGTVALGDLGRSSSQARMTGSQFLTAGRRGHIGTDLSGGHPVSIRMPDGSGAEGGADMGLRSRELVESDQDVRLDGEGKVQCTSCHDPHSDVNFREGRVPHFFVKATVTEACLACHELR